MEPGTRVRWTFTFMHRGKPCEGTEEGIVVDRPTKFGRLAVLDDGGAEHHVQPSFVTVISP